MRVEHTTLPGDLQSSYSEITNIITIDPGKVAPECEDSVIVETLCVLAGFGALAPHARRAAGRHLYPVPERPDRLHAIVEDGEAERVDGVG